jgi:hypothetical protein
LLQVGQPHTDAFVMVSSTLQTSFLQVGQP